jgi:WD40 repeat protein
MNRDTYINISTNQLSSSWDEFLDSLHVSQWDEPTGQNTLQEFDNNQLEYYIIDDASSSDLPPFMLCQPCQPDNEDKVLKILQDPCDEVFFETGDYSTMRERNDDVFSLMYCQPCQPGQEERVTSMASHPSSKAIHTALPYTNSFASGIHQPIPEGKQQKRPNERVCYGHREAVFGLEFSPCGGYMATASQDSTIRIWDVHQHRLLQTLTAHDAAYECLRVTWYV